MIRSSVQFKIGVFISLPGDPQGLAQFRKSSSNILQENMDRRKEMAKNRRGLEVKGINEEMSHLQNNERLLAIMKGGEDKLNFSSVDCFYHLYIVHLLKICSCISYF